MARPPPTGTREPARAWAGSPWSGRVTNQIGTNRTGHRRGGRAGPGGSRGRGCHSRVTVGLRRARRRGGWVATDSGRRVRVLPECCDCGCGGSRVLHLRDVARPGDDQQSSVREQRAGRLGQADVNELVPGPHMTRVGTLTARAAAAKDHRPGRRYERISARSEKIVDRRAHGRPDRHARSAAATSRSSSVTPAGSPKHTTAMPRALAIASTAANRRSAADVMPGTMTTASRASAPRSRPSRRSGTAGEISVRLLTRSR